MSVAGPSNRIPELPRALDPGDRASATVPIRYEDIAQDGRITLLGLPQALGAVTWPAAMAHPDARATAAAGVVPILVRLVLEGTEAAVPATRPLRGEGTLSRWTARSPDGSVDRIVLSMWVSLFGRPGTTWGGADPSAEEALVGRVYAEHVFTRPFAPTGQRRVVELPSGVPSATGTLRAFSEVGGTGEALPDTEIAFGVQHTDSNQHVNSLVYPRVFEELAMRKLLHNARVPAPHQLLARVIELRFRRPFFAGERASIGLRFTDGTPGGGDAPPSKIGVVGGFFQAGAGVAGKPSCSVRMLFR